MNAGALAGWIPVRVYWEQDHPQVEWCYLGDKRFVEPFFVTTIKRSVRQPSNALVRRQTSMDVLADLQTTRPGLPPTGFIFHMSRCGSTLVAQMLAALPQCVVLSEPPPIDDVLRTRLRHPAVPDELRVAWLQALLNALGQRRNGEESHLFVKLDSWHTLDLPLIQRAFPSVPWVFLYRDPVEVVASHLRQPGSQMVPGLLPPALFGFDSEVQPRAEEYCIRVLVQICRAALAHHTESGLRINYRRLPDVVWSELADHFHVDFSADDRDRMRHASRFDAKTPALFFEDDSATKQQAVSSVCRRLSDRWLLPLYERLEAC
jgi:hypothetical protein